MKAVKCVKCGNYTFTTSAGKMLRLYKYDTGVIEEEPTGLTTMLVPNPGYYHCAGCGHPNIKQDTPEA